MALVNLDEARIDEVLWVWRMVIGDPDQAHIYQFGFRGPGPIFWIAALHDIEELPDPLPLCGAPGFQRGSHNPITNELRYNVDGCTWCLVRLVTDYPHLFIQGGT